MDKCCDEHYHHVEQSEPWPEPWETVWRTPDDSVYHVRETHRLKVPGGWLYRETLIEVMEDNESCAVSLCFIPTVRPECNTACEALRAASEALRSANEEES